MSTQPLVLLCTSFEAELSKKKLYVKVLSRVDITLHFLFTFLFVEMKIMLQHFFSLLLTVIGTSIENSEYLYFLLFLKPSKSKIFEWHLTF